MNWDNTSILFVQAWILYYNVTLRAVFLSFSLQLHKHSSLGVLNSLPLSPSLPLSLSPPSTFSLFLVRWDSGKKNDGEPTSHFRAEKNEHERELDHNPGVSEREWEGGREMKMRKKGRKNGGREREREREKESERESERERERNVREEKAKNEKSSKFSFRETFVHSVCCSKKEREKKKEEFLYRKKKRRKK